MRIHTVPIVMTMLLVILAASVALAQEANKPTPTPTPPQFTQEQLEERFNMILARQLTADDIVLSFDGAVRLENIVKKAAKKIVDGRSFDQLPAADKNLNNFATALLSRAKVPFDGTKITGSTITDVLDGWQRHDPVAINAPLKFIPGICPLFPICP